jgi:UDP-GlcNAc:undecaprenyl-phosphate/decaprenyl-phosphate GlcNAc-1-phosphate transferase
MEIALVLLPLLTTYGFLHGKTALTTEKALQRNYRGKAVSRSGGVILLFAYSLAGLWRVLALGGGQRDTLALLYLISGLAFVGLLDDFWGDSRQKGFRGHFKLLIQENRLSTGLIKAFFGGVFAFTAAAVAVQGAAALLVGGLLIALATNTVNSLDLRPGRALKFFLAASVALISISRDRETLLLLLPFLAALLAYLPYDLGEDIMLGDSGANVLGGALGFLYLRVLSWPGMLVALLALLAFQIVCEVSSVSAIIAKNSFLRYLDNLGRVFKGGEEHEY